MKGVNKELLKVSASYSKSPSQNYEKGGKEGDIHSPLPPSPSPFYVRGLNLCGKFDPFLSTEPKISQINNDIISGYKGQYALEIYRYAWYRVIFKYQ